MEDTFNAWLAGFWEGEGSLVAKRPRIEITQAGERGKKVLTLIQRELGFGKVYERKIDFEKHPNWKRQFVFYVSGIDNVLNFVSRIKPYLKMRKEEVEEKYVKLLEFKKRKMSRLWSEEEDAILRKFWDEKEKIKKMLPNRTLSAIKARGHKLGLRCKFYWTEEDINILLKYPRKGSTSLKRMGLLLNHSKRSIDQKRFLLGLTRKYRRNPS